MSLKKTLAPLLIVAACVAVATLVAAPSAPADDGPGGGPAGVPGGGEKLAPEEEARQTEFVRRFREGQRHMGSGRDEEAVRIFRELLVEEPDAAAVHHALGITLRFAGKPDEATRSFLEAARLGPEDAVIQRDAGLDLLSHGRAVDAEPFLGRARALWPQDAESVVGHGNALRAIGRVVQAEKAFREAMAVEPNSVDARVGVAACVVERNPTEALSVLEGAPDNYADVALVMGLAHQKLGHGEKGAELLGKAIASSPPGLAGLPFVREATEALARAGDAARTAEGAAIWLETERSAGRRGLAAAFTLACSRAGRGDGAEALDPLVAALEGAKLDPATDLHFALFRAGVLTAAGKSEEADALLGKVAEVDLAAFEVLAARRILGRLTAGEFAAPDHGAKRANDVAWVEALASTRAGDPAAAATHWKRVAELSDPRGEYPGLLSAGR